MDETSTVSEKGMLVRAISYSVTCSGYNREALRMAFGFYRAERQALDPIHVSQLSAQQAVRISRRARRILQG